MEKGSGSGAAGSSSDFVRKLYKMLEDPTYQHIVRWNDAGDSFVVLDNTEFTRNVLPRHFKHSNFASFVRQLNKYDFHKIRNTDEVGGSYGNQAWEFKHPNFQLHNRGQLDNIKRKAPAARKPPRESEDSSALQAALEQIDQLKAQLHQVNESQKAVDMQMETNKASCQALVTQVQQLTGKLIEYEELIQKLFFSIERKEAKIKALEEQQLALPQQKGSYTAEITSPDELGMNTSAQGLVETPETTDSNTPFQEVVLRRKNGSIDMYGETPDVGGPATIDTDDAMDPLTSSASPFDPGGSTIDSRVQEFFKEQTVDESGDISMTDDLPVADTSLSTTLTSPFEAASTSSPWGISQSFTLSRAQQDHMSNSTAPSRATFPPMTGIMSLESPENGLPTLSNLIANLRRPMHLINLLNPSSPGVPRKHPSTYHWPGLTAKLPPPISALEAQALPQSQVHSGSDDVVLRPIVEAVEAVASEKSLPRLSHLQDLLRMPEPNRIANSHSEPALRDKGKGKEIGGHAGFDHSIPILVVDDDDDIRKFLSNLFAAVGIGADFACDGIEALQLASHKRYRLIFMDNIMPNLDGASTARLLRRSDKQTPIIYMIANPSQTDVNVLIRSGMTAMLAKPFGYKNFFAIMNKYLPHPGGWKRPRSKRTIAKEAEGEGGTSSQAAKANEPNPLVSIEGTGVHAEREPGTKSDARVEDPPAQNSGANERPMLDTAMTDAEHSHNHSHEVSLDADCTPSTAPERVISGDHHEEEGKGSASDVDMDEGGDSDYNSSDFYEDEYEEEMGNNNDDSENEDEEGEDEDEVSSQEADIKEEDESPKMFLANPQTINMHPPWTIDTVNYDGGNPPMAVDLAMTLNGTPKGSSPNLRNRYGTASPSFIGSDGRISTTGIGHVSRTAHSSISKSPDLHNPYTLSPACSTPNNPRSNKDEISQHNGYEQSPRNLITFSNTPQISSNQDIITPINSGDDEENESSYQYGHVNSGQMNYNGYG